MVKKFGAAAMTALLFMGVISGCSGKDKYSDIKTTKNDSDAPRLFITAKDVSYDEESMSDKYLEFVFGAGKEFCSGSDENLMISPASVFFAMELAASGAQGDTLDEMSAVFVPGATNEEALNYASDYYRQLQDSGVIKVANAEYFSEDFRESIYEDYLEYVRENFDAEIMTGIDADKINAWVDEKTDGMIPEIIDGSDITPETVAILLNAIAFDAKWEEEFDKDRIDEDSIFTNASGDEEKATLMGSDEDIYFETDLATGFMKYYDGDDYAFVAILPKDETVSANDFLTEFTADDYREFIDSMSSEDVKATTPEFEYDYENRDVIDILEAMGIETAFGDGADFSNMASTDAFISKIIHKTHISLDRKGTKAAASTAVIMTKNAVVEPYESSQKIVCLDRPFAYMIVETDNMTPVFMGTVNSING